MMLLLRSRAASLRRVSTKSARGGKPAIVGWAVRPLISPRFVRPLRPFQIEPAMRPSDPCAPPRVRPRQPPRFRKRDQR